MLTDWAEKSEQATQAKARAENPKLQPYQKKTLTWHSTYGEISVLEQRLREGRRGRQVRPFCQRVLRKAGLLQRPHKPSRKGHGFVQPLCPHEHWHIDISYLNICGTFYYLCSIIDGASRYIVHWDIRESMTEAQVEIILQAALEKFPAAKPRIISDNGPQFVAKDFKEFIRIAQLTHVRTSPHYPESNGKIERWHGTLKRECIRPKTPLSLEQAKTVVGEFIAYYNTVRLHSATGYITPKDRLENRHEEIFKSRDQKLEAAREQRRLKRQQEMVLTT